MSSSVVIVSPGTAIANNGNWQTAARWARFLSPQHAVRVCERWREGDVLPDVMIALHARRSADSIACFRRRRAHGRLLVALTGTDVYRDIHDDEAAQQSLARADRLLVLQSRALDELTPKQRIKASVLYQSAPTLKPAVRGVRHFDIVQVGHLRHEKDPFTPITALRHLPRDSRIRLTHIGTALDGQHGETMATVCRSEPRLRWLGGLGHAATRQRIKRAHLLVIASRMEGGANVIVEAITSSVSVIASDVSGNVGMLGEHYPGYFPFADATACAQLMLRCERDAGFRARIERACEARAPLFAPEREARGIRAVVARLLNESR